MAVELKVPEVGESVSEVFIGAWLKQEGDSVSVDEPLVEVETDKATVEVPASVSGTLTKVLKAQGESAQVGEVIAHLEETPSEQASSEQVAPSEQAPSKQGQAPSEQASSEQVAPSEQASSKQTPSEQASSEQAQAPGEAAAATGAQAEGGAPAQEGDSRGAEGRVMPAAQRLLDERGVRADQVRATGPGGRLLKEDVQRHLDSSGAQSGPEPAAAQGERPAPAAAAAAPTSSQGERAAPARGGPARGHTGERQEEVVPMSPLRRRIAERLVEAQSNAALLTTFNEIDMSQVMELRKQYRAEFEDRYGVRLGFMSFFVKAAIDALRGIPQLNAEIREQSIVYKNYFDIGVAVSTPKGLVVPVLRNAERMSFAEIESAIGDFGVRAQSNKIAPEELQGGTFTISNGGVFGSLMSTPIVNPPQSGVLGMHTIQERPVAIDGRVEIRPMMYVALTYDHRIVDGREAVTFLKRIKEAVERPTRMLLEV